MDMILPNIFLHAIALGFLGILLQQKFIVCMFICAAHDADFRKYVIEVEFNILLLENVSST